MVFLHPFAIGSNKGHKGITFDWLGTLYWTGMISMAVLLSTHHTGIAVQILLFEALICIACLLLLLKTEA